MDHKVPTLGDSNSFTGKNPSSCNPSLTGSSAGELTLKQVTSEDLGHAKLEQLGFRVCIWRNSNKTERRQKLTGGWGCKFEGWFCEAHI